MKSSIEKDKKFVSIIVPAYNSEKYIQKLIDSILNQTYNNFELIIVNDASVDDTLNIVKRNEKNSDKLNVINLDKNKGVSYARNVGIKVSKGDYLVFIDSDDFISNDFLKQLTDNCISDDELVRAFNFSQDNVYESNEYLTKIAYGEYLGTSCGYLINKEKCKNVLFNETITHMEDTDYITQVIAKYKKVKEVSGVDYTYVDNKDSATRKIEEPNKVLKMYFNSIDIICNRLINSGVILNKNKMNNRKFFLLKNMVKQSPYDKIIDLLNDSENSRILKEKSFFTFNIYKSFFGKMYFIIRSVIKYNILKK